MARVDHLTGGIYRISTYAPEKRISFNQFLIDDDEPALIHTGTFPMYADVRSAITQVLDPFLGSAMSSSRTSKPTNAAGWGVSSLKRLMPVPSLRCLSARINLLQWDYAGPVKGMQDGDVLDLGRHRLRAWETPHVHHWNSLMVMEETTASLFPSDLFIQPNEQPAIVRENLGRICAAGIERLAYLGALTRSCVLLVVSSGLRRPGRTQCTAAACLQMCCQGSGSPEEPTLHLRWPDLWPAASRRDVVSGRLRARGPTTLGHSSGCVNRHLGRTRRTASFAIGD